MTNVDTTAQSPAFGVRGLVAPGLAAGLYAATLFVSALLLFAVQPMFTKMVLPKLGGSPAVWSTAMVAFQAFLFAGYLYAHVMSRAADAGPRRDGAPRRAGRRRARRCRSASRRASTCRPRAASRFG